MTLLTTLEDMPVHPMRHGSGFRALGVRGSDAQMDPFLMVDHFWMSEPTFGPHPHAGFSAVTYMFDDAQTAFQNHDSRGDASVIHPGDLHWTIAGAGVVHDEVPVERGKTAHGLQIFVNLAAKDKHIPPGAMHVASADMPRITQSGGAQVKLVFGTYADDAASISAPITPPTDAALLDVTLQADQAFRYPVPDGVNAFVLVTQGTVQVAAHDLAEGRAATLGRAGGTVVVTAKSHAMFALFMGAPLNEPVVRHGPFAMTNQADIQRAIQAYQAGEMGHL